MVWSNVLRYQRSNVYAFKHHYGLVFVFFLKTVYTREVSNKLTNTTTKLFLCLVVVYKYIIEVRYTATSVGNFKACLNTCCSACNCKGFPSQNDKPS